MKVVKLRMLQVLCAFVFATGSANAQSYATYNHDDAKMNQITVMETGSGSLTPTLYYYTLHRNYQKTAPEKNKLGFRTLAALGAYQQVEYADSIESYLKKRAEVEALNVADRQVDLAWRVEGSKITDKLTLFQNNINKIVPSGGSPADKQRWQEYYKVYESAVKTTRESYLPNAQRKKEYLRIYADLTEQNEILVRTLVLFNRRTKTAELLACRGNYQKAQKATAISNAYGKWREAGRSARGNSSNTSGSGQDEGEETVNR